MFEGLVDALNQLVERKLSDINTNMPGQIISYDAARNRAIVKPSMPKRLAENDPLLPPQIVEVPIVWPASGGGKSSLTMPLKPGDPVMLVFQQRSLENWLAGNNSMPDDPRQFDLSDCVAIAGMQPSGIVGDPDNVVMKFDKTALTLTKDNGAILANDQSNITMDHSNSINVAASTVNIGAGGQERASGIVQITNADLNLARQPTAPNHAATKSYVDSFGGSGGGEPGPPGPEGPPGPPGPQGPPGDAFPDAPITHQTYGRIDATWARVLAITNDIMDGGNF